MKLISWLVYPLTWVILIWLMAIGLRWFRIHRTAQILTSVAFIMLWIISMPITGQWLLHQLEQRYPEQPITAIQPADAILLLGGGLTGAAPPWRLSYDANDAIDRVLYTAQLYHAGKARLIIASGGYFPEQAVQQSEASAMKALLIQLGVDANAIIEEAHSQTTYENMNNTQPILNNAQVSRLLLVTSAAHMPRALATAQRRFGNQIQIEAASCDVRIVNHQYLLLDYLPQAGGLALFTQAWHEWIGNILYHLKGYA